MTNTLMIGKRLVPLETIVLVEPFDSAAHPGIRTERVLRARVVLIDRQSLLTEDAPSVFAETLGFRMLAEEGIALNPTFCFAVETFAPREGFEPDKPYRTRLLWRDVFGRQQSEQVAVEGARSSSRRRGQGRGR